MSLPLPVADLAKVIATVAHLGQTDKAGEPYIDHPAAVAAFVAEAHENVIAAAWLHDVLEDTSVTEETLRSLGCPWEVVNAVKALTRREDDQGDEYYERVGQNSIARVVKRADIRHNTDPRRLAKLDDATQLRLIRKYAHALEALA